MSIVHEAPTARILAPSAGEIFFQGEEGVPVVGEVDDDRDKMSELVASWVLNPEAETPLVLPAEIDENGRVELTFTESELNLGDNDLELRVEDTSELTGFASTWWKLAGPLTVEITSPVDGTTVVVDQTLQFEGFGIDPANEASQLDFEWLVGDGELIGSVYYGEDNQVLITGVTLPAGVHEVTLQATNEYGSFGSDAITVEVLDDEPEATPGDLVFTELMVNPDAVEDRYGEWVEVYNTASYNIDLQGYTFRDAQYDEFTFDDTLIVPGFGYIVLCASTNQNNNGGVSCDGPFKRESTGALALGNNGDELFFVRPDGVEIASLEYEDDWFERGIAIGVDPEHMGTERNNDASYWCNQQPATPGAPNAPCE